MVAGENMRSKEIRIFERYKTLTCFHILIRTTNRKEEVMIQGKDGILQEQNPRGDREGRIQRASGEIGLL